ncbi:MAG TPA: tetratricopeptide repeat protein [Blastocatellia bacterium]|nr:tetratricopeptide repeat protein [Blastocatellia bacterium]
MNDVNKPEAARRKGLAVASLVIGIVSIPTIGLVMVGAITGLLLGIVALRNIKRAPSVYGGQGLAIAGIVTNAVAIIVGVPLMLMGLSALFIYMRRPPASMPVRVRSLAVLPFDSLGSIGPPGEEDSLGFGIADALTTRLGGLGTVVVRPSSSLREYAPVENAISAGRELDVDAVLEGTIQRRYERLRVTARLVNVESGRTLWSDTREELWANLLTVEDSIAEKVIEALGLGLTSEERKRLTRHGTDSVDAHELYLRGRFHLRGFSKDRVKRAIEYYQKAIELDPAYALAYARLAEAYSELAIDSDAAPQDVMPRAREAAMKALELDDQLAEAHASLGICAVFYDRDWARADAEFRRALELSPNYADAHLHLARYLQASGRADEAGSEIRRAAELDPASPVIDIERGWQYLYEREYDRAIEHLRKARYKDPRWSAASLPLARAYNANGMYAEAIAELTRGTQLISNSPALRAEMGCAYAGSGRRDEALRILNELKQRAAQEHVDPAFIALIHASLGQRDQALAELENAYVDRSPRLSFIKADPGFDSLRRDPRFADLVRRMGFAP